MPSPTRPQPSRWLIVPAAMAAACVALAIFVDWPAVFQHEARTAANGGQIVETTRAGARLWRVMLLGSAGGLVVVPLALARLCRAAAREPREADPARRRVTWILAALVAVGLALRALRFGESLWYDEIAVLLDYIGFGPGPVMGNYFVSSNHIAHGLVTSLSVAWLGANEPGMRLPALLASLAAVPVAYALARRCGLSRAGGLVAALLLAAMPVAVLEGVEARAYSMMILLAGTASWLLLRAWDEDDARIWLAYALCVALGVWTHAMTVWVPLGHGAWLIWRTTAEGRPRAAAAAALALVLSALLAVTLYAPVLPDVVAIRSEFRALDGDEPSVFGPEGVYGLLQLGGAWTIWSSLPGLALLGLGAWAARTDERARRALPALWLGLPLAVLAILMFDSWLYARFLLIALPAAAVTIALGVELVARRSPAVAVVAVFVLLTGYGVDLAARPAKQPIRDAVRYVAEGGGGAVGSIGLPHPVVEYYLDLYDLQPAGRSVLGARLDEVLARDPAWMIVLYPRSVPDEAYRAIDAAGYGLEHTFNGWVDWNNGDVLVYGRGEGVGG